ncbi:hypothetical protein [Hart Park virus]|uniref:Uncharacterized protein n=1 Tax=Hart Park virus TaxID=200401 RepID=A0A0D3R1G7_9RHAB|nr:hypothetical protein [Hart Park virus]AJR28498.1 hypothetical protein [Hart Park virus]
MGFDIGGDIGKPLKDAFDKFGADIKMTFLTVLNWMKWISIGILIVISVILICKIIKVLFQCGKCLLSCFGFCKKCVKGNHSHMNKTRKKHQFRGKVKKMTVPVIRKKVKIRKDPSLVELV